jgi:hypothetical protein
VKMALHRREAVVHAVERIDTKAPVDVIGLIGVRQPDRVQVELMKVDRVRLLRIEIGRIAIEGTACCAGLVLRRAEIAADLDPAGEMSRHSPGKPKQANDGFIATADLNSMQEAGRSHRRRIGNADAETRRSRGQRGEKSN